MIGTAIYGIIKTLWKRPNNKLIISRIINHNFKDSSQGNKRGRSRKGIYNQEILSHNLISFKRTDCGIDIGRID